MMYTKVTSVSVFTLELKAKGNNFRLMQMIQPKCLPFFCITLELNTDIGL